MNKWDSRPASGFFLGLLAGSILSAVAWPLGWNYLEAGVGLLIFVVPGLKLAVSIVFFCVPGRRAIGAGVLTSLAIGFLIFFGTCASNFKM